MLSETGKQSVPYKSPNKGHLLQEINMMEKFWAEIISSYAYTVTWHTLYK